ncbi:hypothetical protein EV421DRAFT_1715483 [Armillaria borealis]|uniref:Uncharacterized protein n=1 Tax=Armillaria borealis TaxID=47425 RepID=A0AA39J6J0_9AGAR|nr:hypothetical protein EV421DRAFT_1715483 [Armillaria borealis]
MTDYATQGKTHLFNVVDLHKYKSYQSLYTCLSHNASAAGMIILQDRYEIWNHKRCQWCTATRILRVETIG